MIDQIKYYSDIKVVQTRMTDTGKKVRVIRLKKKKKKP